MVRQTFFLFIKALIFGLLINFGLHQISDIPSPQGDFATSQQMQQTQNQAVQSSP